MNNNIHACLWFDSNAKVAAEFYCSLFLSSKIVIDSGMVVNFELSGQKFMGLNGGPMFKPNPAISFTVICESDDEIKLLWQKLSDGGMVMMALDKYDWSEQYGFVQDRFGFSWQIMKGKYSDVNQKITPTFLFAGKRFGQAEVAVKFYTQLFPQSSIDGILLYTKDEGEAAGAVKHSQFILDKKVFMAMDGAGNHAFDFNEALSFVVDCNTQEEIDYYWDKLTEGGTESQCGWLKDKFGVSWQIVPTILGQLMSDAARAPRVMQAFMQMKKIDIEQLKNA
jgi:predicted 3-demethylubiquinone-9 3-methyltransferase (glyoxalase superfamily)